jgi:hypothetical protein
MSSPSGRLVESNDTSSYPPKRIREAVRVTRWDTSSKSFDKSQEDALSRSEPLINVSGEGIAIESFCLPRSLEPTKRSEPLPVSGSRSAIGMLRRPTLAIAVTAGLVCLVVGRPWAMWTSGANKSGNESSSFWSLSVAQTRADPANQGVAKLIVNQATSQRMGEACPLGVSVSGSGDGELLIVVGLVAGTTLSAGRPLGDNTWWLYAKDLNDVVIQPPPHFVGTMDITFELRRADAAALIDLRKLRFEWVEAEVPEANIKSQAIHQLFSEEIAALLKRGIDLISSGDIAAARLVLRRAAGAGDARAALALAGTYDPMTLEKLRVHGLSPDLAMARHWYEKADELGSPDALRRLEMLAGRPD